MLVGEGEPEVERSLGKGFLFNLPDFLPNLPIAIARYLCLFFLLIIDRLNLNSIPPEEVEKNQQELVCTIAYRIKLNFFEKLNFTVSGKGKNSLFYSSVCIAVSQIQDENRPSKVPCQVQILYLKVKR